MKKTGAKKVRGKSKSNKWGGLLPKKHCLSLLVTMGWSNSLSKWRLRWWHEEQQSLKSPSEPCPEHKMAQANLLAMILEQVEQSMGKPGLFWLEWLEIMGSECSLPWDSESRSPSPTYGRYIHCTWYNTDFRSLHWTSRTLTETSMSGTRWWWNERLRSHLPRCEPRLWRQRSNRYNKKKQYSL